jgi:hypothetical protein
MSANEPDKPPIGDDSLDQLLRDARWPEVSPGTVTRLTQRWEREWAARRRRALLLRRTAALAIAATLLAAATLGWLGLRPTEKPVVTNDAQSTISGPHEPQRPVGVPTPVVIRANENISRSTVPSEVVPSEVVPWRAPNALEELILAAHDRERGQAAPSPVIARHTPNNKSTSGPSARLVGAMRPKSLVTSKTMSAEQARVATAIQRVASEKRADVAAVALELRKSAAIAERILIETLDRGKTRDQLAALRLLAEIGGPLSVAPLVRAVHESALHAAALETLARLADPSVVGELARSEQNPELRRSLLAALLARGEPNALDVFLSFVEYEPTSEAALTAAQTLKDPPIDLLFASLSVPLESHRIAAARVIGRIDGAATTQRLIGMVDSGVNRHEACIALLSSRGPEATRYVDTAARRDPTLAAILSGARLFTPSENPPRS